VIISSIVPNGDVVLAPLEADLVVVVLGNKLKTVLADGFREKDVKGGLP